MTKIDQAHYFYFAHISIEEMQWWQWFMSNNDHTIFLPRCLLISNKISVDKNKSSLNGIKFSKVKQPKGELIAMSLFKLVCHLQ